MVGNGINYSIIMMARYLEERRNGAGKVHPSKALLTALLQTWQPTLAAAVIAGASFAALALTQMRGFSHFGFIGGIGMPFCWLATYGVLPAWVHCSERVWPMRFRHGTRRSSFAVMTTLSRWIVRYPKAIGWGTGIVTCLAIGCTLWYLPRSLEYDFNKLRFKPAAPEETWEARARDQADDVFGQSASPSVILAERLDQVEPICQVVEAKGKRLIGEDGQLIYDHCKSLLTYIPKDQQAKLDVLADIRAMLDGSTLAFLTPEQRQEVEKFRESFYLRPIALADLPKSFVDNFSEMDGRVGLVVYVYPQPTANLWHGKELVKFADLMRTVALPNGETIAASGEAVIFADLLQAVIREGPRLTLYSFLLVLLFVALTFRERVASAYVIGSLLVGVLWLIAAMALTGVKLNFLNFVVLPITFGIGVDYAINVFQRYRQDGRGSMEGTIRNIGGPVFLCSLTTVIGYSVLLISRNMALVSFGMAALIGEVTCLIAALVSLPALVVWRERHR